MRARTVLVPGPSTRYDEGTVTVALVLLVTSKTPLLSKSKLYLKPAATSADDGSDGLDSETVAELPSFTGPLLEIDAVGATLPTVTLAVSLRWNPYASVTVKVTVYVPWSAYVFVGVNVPVVVVPSPKFQ